jgi:hypothetical protein
MTFQKYDKGANAGLPIKLIPHFLPPQLNLLFIEYMLLVRSVQSFVAGLRGNMDVAQQYMNLWAIERDAAMDGEDFSRLVAGAFLEHVNLDIGIVDYRHLAAYFGGAIKQNYCTEFPIDETSGHSFATAARHYANCLNDDKFMDSQTNVHIQIGRRSMAPLVTAEWEPCRSTSITYFDRQDSNNY